MQGMYMYEQYNKNRESARTLYRSYKIKKNIVYLFVVHSAHILPKHEIINDVGINRY